MVEVVPHAVEFDRDAMRGVCQVDLGEEHSVRAVNAVFEARSGQSRINEEIFHHPAPLAERDGIVSQAIREHFPQRPAAIAASANMQCEHAMEI